MLDERRRYARRRTSSPASKAPSKEPSAVNVASPSSARNSSSIAAAAARLLRQVFDPQRCQGDRLLPLTGGRIGYRYVAAITEFCHYLAGALPGNSELSSDGRNGRSGFVRAHSQHAAVGKSAFAEPGIGHRSVQPKLVAEPGPPERRTESR